MKLLILFGVLVISLPALFATNCHSEVENSCAVGSTKKSVADTKTKSKCSSLLGSSEGDGGLNHFSNYVRLHLSYSFQFLLMSTYFGEHVTNRLGFSKLYRKLSDKSWDDAIDIIKFMAKRGHNMRFESLFAGEKLDEAVPRVDNPAMSEGESLAKAVDMQKYLTVKGHKIHKEVHHDADALNYIEDKFAEKHTETLRELAGHVTDLQGLTKENPSLALYLFDEHLKTLY